MENIEKLENNQKEVVTKVVNEVVNKSRVSFYDRSLREKHIIIFGKSELNDEDTTNDEEFLNDLFS